MAFCVFSDQKASLETSGAVQDLSVGRLSSANASLMFVQIVSFQSRFGHSLHIIVYKLSSNSFNHLINDKQGFEEVYTQPLKERNGYSLKLSYQYLKNLNKLRPHKLRL